MYVCMFVRMYVRTSMYALVETSDFVGAYIFL